MGRWFILEGETREERLAAAQVRIAENKDEFQRRMYWYYGRIDFDALTLRQSACSRETWEIAILRRYLKIYGGPHEEVG